ncbi:MAG: hypothetical protein ABIQ16_07665, partial [Polyangiaceae bacterium]
MDARAYQNGMGTAGGPSAHVVGVVSNIRLHSSGIGATRRPLGPAIASVFYLNAVEIQFELNHAAAASYKELAPEQWSGPDGVWYKTELFGRYQPFKTTSGGGSDNPADQSLIVRTQASVSFYDNPGYSLAMIPQRPPVIYVVQNFTSWLSGTPKAGGARKQLSEAFAWYSVTHIGKNPSPGVPYIRMQSNRV